MRLCRLGDRTTIVTRRRLRVVRRPVDNQRTKAPEHRPGASSTSLLQCGSVGRDHRAAAPAELVAEPAEEGVDVARARVEGVSAGTAADLVALALEAVVVGLEADDPVRREGIFHA